MFDSLDEQIKHDLEAQSSKSQRIIKWITVGFVAVLLFGGIYMGVRLVG